MKTKARDWLKTNAAVFAVAMVSLLNGLDAIFDASFNHHDLGIIGFAQITDPLHLSRVFNLILGLILVYLASKLFERSHMAWQIALSILVLVTIVRILFGHNLAGLLLPGVSIILLLTHRDQFRVRNDYALLREGLGRSLVIFLAAVIYGALGFLFLSHRDFGRAFSLNDSLIYSAREIFLLGNGDLLAHTRYAKLLISSLNIAGITCYSLAVMSFFKPLRYRLSTLPTERRTMEKLLKKYGGNSEDFFKLWPSDKRYWIRNQAALAYRVVDGVALVLGDPTGRPEDKAECVASFFEFSRLNAWRVGVVHCQSRAAEIYLQQKGTDKFKVGEEAIVHIETFLAKTLKGKRWRNIRNRFTKLGYKAELLPPEHSAKLINELRAVSDKWLSLPGREEHTFGLGYFDEQYLSKCPILTIRDEQNKLVAFLNLVPSFKSSEANVDLFRHLPDALTNVNDFMFLSLMELLDKDQYKSLNLGLCPLKGVENFGKQATVSQVAKIIYNTNFLFAFRGLTRFKSKFEPSWRDSYMVYQGGSSGLLRTALAVNKALKLPTDRSKKFLGRN